MNIDKHKESTKKKNNNKNTSNKDTKTMQYDKESGLITKLPKGPAALTIKIFTCDFPAKTPSSQFPDIKTYNNWIKVKHIYKHICLYIYLYIICICM